MTRGTFQFKDVPLPIVYINHNTGVYRYIASRAGGDIPAYCPIAKQEGDMQYIARTQ